VNGAVGTVIGLCVISLKFCTISKTRVEIGTGNRISPLWGIVSNSILGAYLRHRSRCLCRIWSWCPPMCGMLPSNIQDGRRRPSRASYRSVRSRTVERILSVSHRGRKMTGKRCYSDVVMFGGELTRDRGQTTHCPAPTTLKSTIFYTSK